MSESTITVENQEPIELEKFFRATVEESSLSYIQLLRPIILYPTYVSISQTAFEVNSLSFLDTFLQNPDYREYLLSSLHLGQPTRIVVRPSVHTRDEVDFELRFALYRIEHYPGSEFRKYLIQENNLPDCENVIMKISVKTATRKDIMATLTKLLEDMLRHEIEDKEHWHGLLVVYLSGYRFKPDKKSD